MTPTPTNSPREFLKRFPLLVSVKKKLFKDATTLDVLKTFPIFIPYSVGSYRGNACLTIHTINQTMPFLSSLASALGQRKAEVLNIRDFPASAEERQAAGEFKKYCDRHGSDKANFHDYHYLYGPLLKRREEITGVFEVGLGTNNVDVASNMGAAGRPGASLRAFREFLKNAKIYGADIDKRILFQEERIETFYVDQTDPTTFSNLDSRIPGDLDLVIDDGLHSPDANIATLAFGLAKIRAGGWVAVEDIGPGATPVWEVVSALLPDNFRPYLIKAEGAMVFAVQRLR